jgi:predicted enzyme related to lactoylglutathione lyase
MANKVIQMRLVVEAEDLDTAVDFYRNVLGLEESLFVESDGGAKVHVLEAGRATLELINPAQRRLIDQLEVGEEVSRQIRVAFEVSDSAGVTEELSEAGAEVLAPPTETPWHSLNARLEGPAGLQLTIFEQMEPE